MNVIDRPAHRVNELDPQMLALHALSPTSAYSAPARGTMFAGHFSQRPVISGSEPQLTQSGIADEFGKYTFSVKMPEDGIICRIIPRYAPGIGEENIAVEHESPETLVIYRKKETGEYDYFMLPYYMSNHPTFGFKFEPRPALDYLKVGYQIDKDTVFLDTPANKGESHYTFGRNLNVIYMSHPSVGLDGYVISRDVLPYYSFKVYETRTIDIGANTIPLNLYGDNDTYRPFPELGEYILESGLLMATRKFDPYMAPAILSQRDLQTVDWVHDKKVFSRPGKGKVIDMNIIRSENINRQLPEEMTKQLQKYANAGQRYHRDIVRFEEQIIKESRDMGNEGRILISPALQCLLRTSKGIINYGASRHKQPLTLTYKREPLDTWRATFTIEYEIIPERGFKFTCGSGGGLKFTYM